MDNASCFEILRKVYFFKDLNDEEIALVAASCVQEDYLPGDRICEEGAKADRFYIVIDGQVEVWKNYREPKPDLLAVHGPGHFFGEMALVDDLPRSATVVAKDRTRVLYLNRDDFRRLITERSSIALSVMTAISFMVRNSNEVYVEDLRKRNDELEKAYTELEKAQSEMLRNERLSTLGKFSSLILHDIRNPLSALKCELQLMQVEKEDPAKLNTRIEQGLSDVERLEMLAAEFLDYSRGEIRLNLTVIKPSLLLEQAAADLKDRLAKAGRPISVRLEPLYDEAAILDAERVRRAIHNIADNSVKAMSDSGGSLVMRSKKEDGYLVFEVSDTGEGMSKEVLSHLFEPFFSVSGKGGTGLGMLIVKNIVETHGGRVSIVSEPGKGTSVSLLFPLKQ